MDDFRATFTHILLSYRIFVKLKLQSCTKTLFRPSRQRKCKNENRVEYLFFLYDFSPHRTDGGKKAPPAFQNSMKRFFSPPLKNSPCSFLLPGLCLRNVFIKLAVTVFASRIWRKYTICIIQGVSRQQSKLSILFYYFKSLSWRINKKLPWLSVSSWIFWLKCSTFSDCICNFIKLINDLYLWTRPCKNMCKNVYIHCYLM